jgi:hypothetical protein
MLVMGLFATVTVAAEAAPSASDPATPATPGQPGFVPHPGDGGVDEDKITIEANGKVIAEQKMNTEGKAHAHMSGEVNLQQLITEGVVSVGGRGKSRAATIQNGGSSSAQGCTSWDIKYTRNRSFYGTHFITYYVFHLAAYVCWNSTAYGGVVHGGQGDVYTFFWGSSFSNVDPLWEVKGLKENVTHPYNWNGVGPYSGHYFHRKHHIVNYIGIGPVSQPLNEYPWLSLWVHSNGTISYDGGR